MMKTAGVMRPLLYCLVLAFSVQPAGAGDGRAVYGNVFRSFGVIVEDDVSQGFQADLASPWGWTVAFGSESRLKDGLWLAGEVGFRYVSGRARQEQLNVSKEQSFSWGYLYTALTLQFRLF